MNLNRMMMKMMIMNKMMIIYIRKVMKHNSKSTIIKMLLKKLKESKIKINNN